MNTESEAGALFQYRPIPASDVESYTALLESMAMVAKSPYEKELMCSALDSLIITKSHMSYTENHRK